MTRTKKNRRNSTATGKATAKQSPKSATGKAAANEGPNSAAGRLFPVCVTTLPLQQLTLAAELAEKLQAHGVQTLGALFDLPDRAFAKDGWLADDDAVQIREAVTNLLRAGLRPIEAAAASGDWRSLKDLLLDSLDREGRALFVALVGLEGRPSSRTDVARRTSRSLREIDDRSETIRARLLQAAPALLERMRATTRRDLEAHDGVLRADNLPADSVLHVISRGSGDPLLGMRLAAFCFPREFHLHREALCAETARAFRRLLRTLPRRLQRQRLPIGLGALHGELAAEGIKAPLGLLRHLLVTDLHVNIEPDGAGGERIVSDPRSTNARLVSLLQEAGRPMRLEDLLFAYRERFRRASLRRLEQLLRCDPTFVLLGPETWSLRQWHDRELQAVGPIVDRVARRICSATGRQNVAVMLATEKPDDRTIWLVLDRLGQDPRVRLLGRGDACAASHKQSQVLEQLMTDFRRAAGDVVMGMFLDNQPPARRRLVERLLRWNRLFVIPADDRIDLLSNYPFNEERLRRLADVVGQQLEQRAGYAHVDALKAAVDRTDLGGEWLSPQLLADVLRRNCPFDVLPGGVVSRREIGLAASLMRSVRQALRAAGAALSPEEILAARPDLAEFADCIRELLPADPMLQTPDGARFTLV